MVKTKTLNLLFQNFIEKNKLPKAIIKIQKGDGHETAQFEHGGMTEKTPFLLASVSKLWVTTLILQLIDSNKLHYNSIVTDFIPKEKLKNSLCIHGKDQTAFLTVKDLLYQRSGFGNVFLEEPILLKERIAAEDFSYTIDDMLSWVSQIEGHFLPDSDEAYYADINFYLLGEIVEYCYHLSLDDCVNRYIMEPLGLFNSYLVSTEFDNIPPLYTTKGYLNRPKVIASGQGAGGGVSTTADLMVFIRAFIEGRLFDMKHWQELKNYRALQGDYAPVQYGGGHMKIVMGQYDQENQLSFIGHSGLSGAFAFYCPKLDVYLTGTTDNVSKSELCIQLMYLILFELEKEESLLS